MNFQKLIIRIKRKTYSLLMKVRLAAISFIVINRDELPCHAYVKYHALEASWKFDYPKTGCLGTDERYRQSIGEKKVAEMFVAELDDAILIGPYGIPITPGGRIVLEPFGKLSMLYSALKYTYPKFPVFRIFFVIFSIRFKFFRPSSQIGNCIHMIARHGRSFQEPNYAHWVLENLPQLRLLEELGEFKNEASFLIRANSPRWIYQTLEFLDVESNCILEHHEPAVRVRRLFIPRLCFFHSNGSEADPVGRKWVSRKMRGKLVSANFSSRVNKKIFLSRPNQSVRRLVNRTEVAESLSDIGYYEFLPEQVGLEEQISIFNNAEVIVGVAGAGLANAIHCNTNAVLVVIENENSVFDCWFMVAAELGLKFRYFPGSEVSISGKGVNADLMVDIDRLVNELKAI